MKSKFMIGVGIVGINIAVCAGFGCGYWFSRQQNKADDKGVFIMTLAALEDLRDDKLKEGIARVESICYASAVPALEDPRVRNLFASSLRAYRDKFATNKAAWTPTELKLNSILTSSAASQ
jgi:hypothetical protein